MNTRINTVRRVPLSSARKTMDLITDVYYAQYPGKAATVSLVFFRYLFGRKGRIHRYIFSMGFLKTERTEVLKDSHGTERTEVLKDSHGTERTEVLKDSHGTERTEVLKDSHETLQFNFDLRHGLEFDCNEEASFDRGARPS